MADFNIPALGAEIKPMPSISLADMVQMARGVQAYQQAQQINPLELQQKQQATRTGEINLGVAEQANLERQNMQRFFSNPSNFQTDGRIDLNKINNEVTKLAPLTGADYIAKFSTLANAQTTADSAIQQLNQSDRALFAAPLSILAYSGNKDPNAYKKVIQQTIEQNKNNPRLATVGQAYLTQLDFIPPDVLPDAAIKASQNLMTPKEVSETFAPQTTVTENGRTVTTQRVPGAAQTMANIAIAGGLQQPQGGGAINAGVEIAPGMRLPYAKRTANQPYIPEPSEAKDQAAGEAYRNALIGQQPTLATARRNVEETIKQAQKIESEMRFAKGGLLGEAERKIRTAVASDEYKMLAKDLANLQISNLRALGQGGNTVAGMDLTKVASGDESVPPGTLVKIARRAQADMTNIDMQANGAEVFKNKFGDNNMNAYKQAWNANADTKIFEGINIIRDATSEQEAKQKLEELFPKAAERKIFFKKYRNLKSLSTNGVPEFPLTSEDK